MQSVVSSDRALSIHPLPPQAAVRVEIVNRADSAVTFFLSGSRNGMGFLVGGTASDPGRLLLVGADTTLAMAAQALWLPTSFRDEPRAWSVPPGDTLPLTLLTVNVWMLRPPQARSPLAPHDSASAARLFGRALEHGRIVYVGRSRDTLAVTRLPGAEVHFRAEDQPSALD